MSANLKLANLSSRSTIGSAARDDAENQRDAQKVAPSLVQGGRLKLNQTQRDFLVQLEASRVARDSRPSDLKQRFNQGSSDQSRDHLATSSRVGSAEVVVVSHLQDAEKRLSSRARKLLEK